MRHFPVLAAIVPCATLLVACSPQGIHQEVAGTLQLSSSTIAAGAIPDKSGCKGADTSPEIAWSNPPPGTQSMALIMDDKDNIEGHLHRHYGFHWLAYNIPVDRHEFAEGQPRQSLPDGTQQGHNDLGQQGYSGPCPGAGSTHHYAITVYALDTKLTLPGTANGRQLLSAIDGHILAMGQLVGTYTH